MDNGMTTGRMGCYPVWLCLALLLAQAANPRAVRADDTIDYDCGVNALFILLRLAGRPVTLDRLTSVLPPRPRDGYSMAELAAASSSLGLGLEGVEFRRGDEALGHPAIVFLKSAKGGHFAVLRPVGTTGTMVQVIDPPNVPWIADYDLPFSVKSWTGRVLVPRDPWYVRYASSLIAVLGGVALFMVALQQRRRPRSATTSVGRGSTTDFGLRRWATGRFRRTSP